MLRDIRAAPFCWQHREAIDRLCVYYDGQSRSTAVGVYTLLTYLASDQHTPDQARAFVATIAELCGLGQSTVRRYLNDFESLGILTIERSMIGGRLNDMNRYLLVTPPPASGRGTPEEHVTPPPASGRGTPDSGRQPQKQINEEQNHEESLVFVAQISEQLEDVGVTPAEARRLAERDPDLAAAWLEAATWRTARDPAALLIAKLRAGEKPPRKRDPWALARRA